MQMLNDLNYVKFTASLFMETDEGTSETRAAQFRLKIRLQNTIVAL